MMDDFIRKIDIKNIILLAWRDQLPRIRLTLFISFAVAFLGILGAYTLSLCMEVPLSWLTRDPASVSGLGFYIGMFSNLGVMGWAAATGICFWAASLLGHEAHVHKSVVFLMCSGFLCLLLTFDDAFMLHESVLPLLHIPEKVVFLGYLLVIAGYGGCFLGRILKTEYLLLTLAFCFLGLSIAMDQILPFSDVQTFLEDSSKFVGIVFWVAYFSRTAYMTVKHGFAGKADSSVSG